MSLIAALLAAKKQRDLAAQAAQRAATRYADIATELRAWLYPEQAWFFRSPAKRKATTKTRRAGVTSGGCHEFIARALETPGWRGMYCNEVREEAKRLAWRADTKQGLIDIIERLASEGKLTVGQDRRDFTRGADVKVDEQALTIEFRNGSLIRLFAADDARAQERARGGAPHVCWVDESQKFPFLRQFVDSIIGPSLTDYDGEIWLTGTPSEWLDGYFYDVTQEDEAARVKGWEIHALLVTMNPFYGATTDERWARTAGAELERNGWDANNPPPSFLREWLAQWVKTDARFVYSVHRWPEPVEFAPMRHTPICPGWLAMLNDDGKGEPIDRWYDHAAAVRDLPLCLPGTATRVDWFFGLGADFGYNPDPFAVVLWAFTPMLPGLYEMWSWKRTLVLPDYQREAIRWFFDNVPGLVYGDGDPGGLQGSHMEGWREFLGIPMENAEKSAKRTWIELFNNDGERGRIKMREGSSYLHEMRHLTWKQVGQKWVENADRKLADGSVPGNHECDAGLYSYRRYVSRKTEDVAPPPAHGSPEWFAAEEKRMREGALEATRRRLAAERGEDDEW